MGELILLGFAVQWNTPAFVGTADALDVMVGGPGDAIRYMKAHFTSRRGPRYWRAHSLCHLAITGEIHPDFCRQPFLDAWHDQCICDTED